MRQSHGSNDSRFDNRKDVLTYAFFVIPVAIVISSIVFSIDSLDIELASAAEMIEVCCFWNENLDDGILMYVVDSDNK